MKSFFPKETLIGWLSSLVEAYNMAIYCFTVPLLAPYLFQKTAILSSYILVFLGSSIFYPLGAIYFGFLGDRKGRQKLCIYSTLGLAIATGMMGLPLYLLDQGWIYYLFLICAQHFFSGGEYHGSIVYSLEHSGEKRIGLLSALSCLFAVAGLVLANGVASTQWMHTGFFLGFLGGLLSFLLKNYCLETPVFIKLSQDITHNISWLSFLKFNWKKIVLASSILAFFIVSYSFIFIFLPLTDLNQSPFSTFKALIVYGILLVVSGVIVDRFGMNKIILYGISLFSIFIIPACYFFHNLFILQMILVSPACLVIGPIHGWLLEQFTPAERCRGIFLSSALAIALFGGTTVPFSLLIFEQFKSCAVCGIYPLLIALFSYGSFLYLGQRKKAALA